MRENEEVKIPDVLSCLITHDAATNRWLGHCLDFDLITSGKTPDAAWEHILGVVKVHVENCFTHHRAGLRFRARQQHWDLFEALNKKTDLFRQEKITLRLVQPEEEQQPPVWMKGIETEFGGACGRPDSAATAVSAVH